MLKRKSKVKGKIMNSLLNTLIATLFGATIVCFPLNATNSTDGFDDDCTDEHVTCFYLDDEDDDEDECSEESEPWHHRSRMAEYEDEGEEEAWNLQLDSAWPGQREDYSDSVIR